MKIIFILLIIVIIILLLLLLNTNKEGFTYNPPTVTNTMLRSDNTCSDPQQQYKIDRFDYIALPVGSNAPTTINAQCPSNYESYNYTYNSDPEVFFVNSNVTQANAASVCSALGSGIVQATYQQLSDSFQNTMNVCIKGWVSDRANLTFMPINDHLDFGNGATNPDCTGLAIEVTGGPKLITNAQLYENPSGSTDTAGVYCYGVKPPITRPITQSNKTSIGANNIAYFNKIQQSLNDNIYCLPKCSLLGSNFNNIMTASPTDPTLCLTSDCQNSTQLSNNIVDSWNEVCAILAKTNNSYNKSLSNIANVNSNLTQQYNIVNDFYGHFDSVANGWRTSDTSKYSIALPYLSNIESDYSNIQNIKNTASNNYTSLVNQKIDFDKAYVGFMCSNFL